MTLTVGTFCFLFPVASIARGEKSQNVSIVEDPVVITCIDIFLAVNTHSGNRHSTLMIMYLCASVLKRCTHSAIIPFNWLRWPIERNPLKPPHNGNT